MTDAQPMKTMYQTTTVPVDDAGNEYFPVLVPTNVKSCPVTMTEVAPTQEQLAAGKALKFDWASQQYVESGEDPLQRQLAAVSLKLAEQTTSANQQIAALGLKLATATAALNKATAAPADGSTTAAPTNQTAPAASTDTADNKEA